MPSMQIIKVLHKLILIIPLYLLLMGVLFLIDLDIEYIQDTHILHIVLGFLLFFATIHGIRLLIMFFGHWLLGKTLRDFTPETHLNRYKECQQISYCAAEKREHIVILLHGFTTSPMDWEILANCLKQEKIDFHAPLIHGFGQIEHNLMLSLNKEDWFRQVVDTYDLFAQRYQHISIIGHSMGGMLACYLAQVRPVQELIISAPALFPQKQETFYARIVKNGMLTNIVSWLIPIIPKPLRGTRKGPADTMDTESTYHYFQYLVAPIRLFITMLQSQLEINLDKMQYQNLTLMYGEHDITVENHEIEAFFEKINIPFQSFCFNQSAHNIFVDFDRETINQLIVQLLNQQFKSPDTALYTYHSHGLK